MNKIHIHIKENKYLYLILLLALILRFPGVFHGLPIIFSTDEPSYVGSVIGLRFSSSLNRFDWPHTHFYFGYIVFLFFYYFRAVLNTLGLENIIPILWSDPSSYYVILRLLNVFLGSFTVIPIFLSTKELTSSKKLGLFSALVFTLIPFHINESSLALLDIAMTFWIGWFIYFSIKIIKNPTRKNFILSGIFMGLAFGTKYNAIFYYVFFAICILYSVLSLSKFNLFSKNDYEMLYKQLKNLFSRKYISNYFYNIFSFLIVYFITNYQVLTDFDLFWSHEYGRGFLFQFDNIKTIPLYEYPNALATNLFINPINDLSLPLYIFLILLAVLFLFFKYRSKKIKLTFLFPLIMYFYISTKSRSPSHYFIFLYPLMVMAIVIFIKDLSDFSSKVINFINTKKSFYFLSLLLIVSMSFYSLKQTYILSREDTRNILQSNLSKYTKDAIPIYYYGNLLTKVDFQNNATKINRLDDKNVDVNNVPFYLVIGIESVDYESLVINMKHKKVSGWTSKFLRDAILDQYINNNNRTGPPIYVFKVTKVYEK